MSLWSCPNCGGANLTIPRGRHNQAQRDGPWVKRRRKCRDCGELIRTLEFDLRDHETVIARLGDRAN